MILDTRGTNRQTRNSRAPKSTLPDRRLIKKLKNKQLSGFPKDRVMGLRKYIEDGVVIHTFGEHEANQIESDVFLALCEAVDSPRALAAWILYNNKEYLQLISLDISPLNYQKAFPFQGDYLVTKFFSKYQDFNVDVDREGTAFSKWLAAEEACRLTNETFRLRWVGRSAFPSSDVESVISRSRQMIHRILGPVPDDILSHGGFGPGADTDTTRNKISRYYKYGTTGSSTPPVLSLIADYVQDDRRDELIHSGELVSHSRLTFVPKTAKVDRAICVEPRWNIFYQLSVGRVIQRRLLRFGVDITDQNRNRDLASRAHLENLSTVDLSSASDSISTNLVVDMFPEEWLDILLKLRCPWTQYQGRRIRLEKISSMGNGYTFPLETLIFFAVTHSVCKHMGVSTENVSAYGDDLIVPSSAYGLLVETLNSLGFSVNTDKSYHEGLFFESCGADFFSGWNVRPIFHKRRIRNVAGAIRLANQIVEFARRSTGYSGFDNRFTSARKAILGWVPKELRLLGPINAGDSVFHAPFDECRPPRAGNGWEGYRVKGIVSVPRRFPAYGDSLLFAKLDGPDMPGNYVTRRGEADLRVKKVYVPQYDEYCII